MSESSNNTRPFQVQMEGDAGAVVRRRQGRLAEATLDLAAVEAALLDDLSVEACAVVVRETTERITSLVAFVVPAGLFVPERLHTRLQALLPVSMLPAAYVPVSGLPLTVGGDLDEGALARLPVIDAALAQRWEAEIQALADVDQVAVVVQERVERPEPLHLADVLPAESIALVEAAERPSVQATPQPHRRSAPACTPPALVHGGPLDARAADATTLPAVLHRAARQHADKGVLSIQSDGTTYQQTYRDVLEDAQRITAGLRQRGLQPQDKVLFQVALAQDFIPAFWGCVLGGFVPVPIAVAPTYEQRNSAVNKLQHAWQSLEHPLVLSCAGIADRVRSVSELLGLADFHVATVDDLRACAPDRQAHPCQPDDAVLLLLTSGSTGLPKGVVLSHANILAMSAGTTQMNGFTAADVTLNWMPLDHVGAIVFLSIMAVDLGCQQLHVPSDLLLQQPLKWLDLIAHHKATISWAPNFAFSLLNDRAEELGQQRWDLSSMRFLVNAGEAIVAKTARRFLQLLRRHDLPAEALRPAFGMSETCSGITWSAGLTLENTADDTVCVELGRPIPGASMRIVDERAQVVEELVVGRVQFQGPSVTAGYLHNPALNQEVFTADGWFNTGDLGYMDDGRLVVTGRDKDDIIINGVNYYSHEIEALVETVPGVAISYTAACAVRVPGVDTEQLAIFFHTPVAEGHLLTTLLKTIRGQVVQHLGVNVDYLIPVAPETIPKTSIGKIQRAALRQRFAEGEFDATLYRLGTLRSSARLLPDWFYTRHWRRQEAATTAPLCGRFLVFLDDVGLGAALCQALEDLQVPCVRVERGEAFARLGPSHYYLAPGHQEHYRSLLQTLSAEQYRPDVMVHLWTYGAAADTLANQAWLEQAQEQGAYSLLFLVQALAQVWDGEQRMRLQIISNRAQAVVPGDEIAYEKAPLLGLMKTVSQEMPWLSCHHLDVAPDQVEQHVASVVRELQVLSREREVAYRGGQRWVPRLRQVDMRQAPKQALPWRSGGMYLVSGGLGGIGVQIARYLLQHYEARLLLLGRSPLPAQDTWEAPRATADPLRHKLEAFQALEQLPGHIVYRAVDICDRDHLQQVVAEAQALWGQPLDGVIHLAGTYHECALRAETRDDFAAVLRPKVRGTWNVYELLKDRPDAVFISFSSITSFFGGSTVGAFAAASRFQENFSHYLNQHSRLRSYCYSWGLWDETGISRGSPLQAPMRARGYQSVTRRQGLSSFLVSLHHNQPQVMVGLDSANLHIRREMEAACYGIQQLTAYVSAAHELPAAGWQALEIDDRFGARSTCEVQQLRALPRTASGAIDRALLAGGNVSGAGQVPHTQVEQQIARIWQEVLGLAEVGLQDNFFELGGHSLLLVQTQSRLQEVFGAQLSVVDMFKYPTIEALAHYVTQGQVEDQAVQQGLARANVRVARRAASSCTDIAVIGMACRFPGADTIDAFWQNLRDGVESITWYTDAELLAAGIDPATLRHPNYVKASPSLSAAEYFDAGFFDYSAREAELMDPQQRLLLECTWECLEAAGYNPPNTRSKVGMYAGASMNTYLLNNIYPNRHRLDPNDNLQVATLDSLGGFQMMVANDKDYLTTRVSYKLNLTGPSVNVQTACSTALLAVHLACQSLLAGECDMAVAGGSSVQAPQQAGHLYQEGMIVSSDGHCRAFDARADGTIFGSGVGVVLLKRLDEALADGDPLLAVIKGSAANNDGGTKVGYMAPSGDGQAAVVVEALALAGLAPETIGYVEAHGTGTRIGDPIEVNALTQAFRANTEKRGFCALGSVKTNVGHLQIASGIVGFIKTVLALQHKMIPPSLHFATPNPAIDFAQSPFYVNTTLTPWPTSGVPRRAGVNSLGIGGTNVHVILEEAPQAAAVRNDAERPHHVLTLSARTDKALVELASRYATYLAEHPEMALADVCYTANTGRKPCEYRLAVVAGSSAQLHEDLTGVAGGQSAGRVIRGRVTGPGRPRLAFLFTGQGSQYVGMGRQLYETQPTFRRLLERCAEMVRPMLDVPLLDVLYPASGTPALLDETAYTQPALFALEYALAELWQSWGITPSVVMGHSLGEYVAACVAGVFSLEDGLKLVVERARLMQALPHAGAMVVVFAPESQVRPLLEPCAHEAAIAAVNGPQHTVIAGRIEAVETIVAHLQAAGVRTQRVQTSHAFHSPLMEPMLADFARLAGQITYASPQIDLVSNLTGALVSDAMTTPAYWCRHIRQPVQFMAGMETLSQQGCEIFVEIGPRPTLLGMGTRCLTPEAGVWLPSLRQGQEDWPTLLHSLGTLWVHGAVDWAGFERDYQRRRVTLPTYPFQRQRYWMERPDTAAPGARPASHRRGSTDPLLGHKLQLPLVQTTIYENHFSTQALPFLQDHRVFDTPVVSGACHIAMLLAAATRTFGKGAYVVQDMYFPHTLIVPEGQTRTVQLALTPAGERRATCQLISFAASSPEEQPAWAVHAAGTVAWGDAQQSAPARPSPETMPALWARCREEVTAEAFFQAQGARHIDLGPSYRWIESIRRGDGEAVCRLTTPATLGGLEGQPLHPGLLDACFGLLLATAGTTDGATWLPFSIDEVRLYEEPNGAGLWGHLVLRQGQTLAANRLVADAQLCDDRGQVLIEFVGLEARPASREAVLRPLPESAAGLFYDVAWRPLDAAPPPPGLPTTTPGQWLILADRQGTAQRLAQQLRARGARCVLVAAAQGYGVVDRDSYHVNPAELGDFQRLLHDSGGEEGQTYRGVVHCWSLDAPALEEEGSSPLEFSACRSVLSLVRALSESSGVPPPRLTLVTRGARQVVQTLVRPHTQQAGVWGLGRVVHLEHPELQCLCCDLDPEPGEAEAEALRAILEGHWEENQMALRQGTWYGARLRRRSLPEPDVRPALHPEGTYLITGGTGGLGLAIAAHLAARGARHLVLVSRRGASEHSMTAIKAIQRTGARVRVMPANVADREAMAQVFATIAAEMPPLRGVMHAAGLLEDGVLATQDWEHFHSVFPAKASGAWLLHQCTEGMDLDFFVLFSSAASVLGNWGQGNYAAANAFLDELAHFRRGRGLTATSINWGVWDQVGLIMSRTAVLAHMEKQGLRGIHTDQGIEALERILAANLTQVAVLPCDWSHYQAQLARPDPLLSELVEATQLMALTSQNGATALASQLQQTPAAQRKALLTAVVRDMLRHTLSFSGDQALDPAEPLMNQGLDSLMAVQFRAELGQALQRSFPVSLVFNYPSVNDIVDYLLDSLAVETPQALGSMSQAPSPPPTPISSERDEEVVLTAPGQRSSTTDAARDVLADLEKLLH